MKKKSEFTTLVALCVIIVLVLLWGLLHRHRKPTQTITGATVVADFKNRSGGAQLPQYWLGTNGVGSTLSDANGMNLITSINLVGNRVWVQVDSIYPYSTSTPNWKLLDQQIGRMKAAGLRDDIVIQGTPKDLGPSSCSVPSNLAHWALLASSVVQHIESNYPSVGYEIINEPDGGGICNSTNQLTDWMNMFAAVAPLIRANAPTAKIGGPTLASPGPHGAQWIPAVLSNPQVYPFIDFVSFHLYITGNWELSNGMTWDVLYKTSQSTTAGLSYYYRFIEAMVRQGHQPNAATTPVIITEFNSNYAYQHNCCQNDPVYGPLWNAVAVTDWMNTVNDGAKLIPSRLKYFAAMDVHSYFCLQGDAGGTDCAPITATTSGLKVYPQYLTYQLLCSADYLNLESTGATVVGGPQGSNGVIGATLYTADSDILLLINPTANSLDNMSVQLNNLGELNIAASQYMIAQSQLLTQPANIAITAQNQATVTLTMAPYSVVALKLHSHGQV